jgi:hypothetical protein
MTMIYYVSPDGADENPGTLEQPFASLERAQAQVRTSARRGKEPITVFLRGGTHYLAKPIQFLPADSGAEGCPVSYRAFEDEEVIVSGGSRLALDWQPCSGQPSPEHALPEGVLQAATPGGLDFDQLFVNGKRQIMARYPNFDPELRPYNGFAADAFSPSRAARWKDPAGGFIHAMHSCHWGGYHYRITGKDANGDVTYEGGWQNNRQMGMHEEHRFVENIFEELDASGEWFHDKPNRMLYYYPDEGVDMNTASVEVASLKGVAEFCGSEEAPVRHVELAGLIFRHTARTFMETREPLLRSDWTIYRGGTVTLTGTEDCVVSDCEFDAVGGNAVFVNRYNRRVTIRGCHIHDAGASGVCFVGSPDSVRSPLFEYNERHSYGEIDKTPGPRGTDFPDDCLVDDCLIHTISLVEKQATGVQVSMSRGITVRHCSIYDVGRAGINFSEGTFGGHVIEFCDVFDTVRETDDHGSFNSWGRDRFWNLAEAPAAELAELSLLDAGKSIIRNSRWRCEHGWDVDLDDGSSNFEIYNNLLLCGGLKLREGFHRHVYNNICVNSTLHAHCWYEGSRDVVTHNIWMKRYRPAGMKEWGTEVDHNLFTREEDRQAFVEAGCDHNSLAGDPLFVDPATGDYRVREGSPALALGFKNFPMDQFGVQKPALKDSARTPELPLPVIEQTEAAAPSPASASAETWLGATVRAISGREFSAFGVRKDHGGIHLIVVPPESRAAQTGFEQNDLVQVVNGQRVRTVAELTASSKSGDGLQIQYVRGQKKATLAAPPSA